MMALLWAVATASFLGSLHCMVMCGPLVGLYCGSAERPPGTAHVFYHVARLLVYALLGTIAGAIGSAVDLAGHALSLHRAAALIGGTVLIAFGVLTLLARKPAGLSQGLFARRTLVRLRTAPPQVRASLLGFFSATLPCGWLWAFVVSAAATGSALSGAFTMTAFWFGTVPALLASTVAWRGIGRAVGKRLPLFTAVLLMLVGAAALAMRAPMLSHSHTGEPAAEESCH